MAVCLPLVWSGLAPTSALAAQPRVTKEVANQKDAFVKGDQAVYRINLTCDSLEGPCKTASVTDVLDPNLTYSGYVSGARSDLPVSLNQSGQTLTWTVGDASDPTKYFMDGETFDITLTTKVKSVPAGGTIDNVAEATVGSNTATSGKATITVKDTPAVYDWGLQKTKVSPSGNPVVGGTVSYDIRFTRPRNAAGTGPRNAGGADISSFVLTDLLPAGAQYVGGSVDGGGTLTYHEGSNTVTVSGPGIEADNLICWSGDPCVSYYVAHIQVKYPEGTFSVGQEVVNTASAQVSYVGGNPDPNPALNASAPVTLAGANPVLWSQKSTNSFHPVPGETVTWTIQGRNDGNVTLETSTLIDRLPGHVHDVSVGAADWYMPTESALESGFEYTVDGTTWLPLGSLGRATSDKLTVPVGATAVRLSVKNQPVGQYQGFTISAVVDDDAQPGAMIENCLSTDGSAGAVVSNCANYTVKEKPQLAVYPSKNHVIASGGAQPGDEFPWVLDWRVVANTPPTSATVTDLLPSQFELVAATAPCLRASGIWDGTPTTCGSAATTPAYTTEDVAGGTRITFADLDLPKINKDAEKYVLILKVRVKDGVSAGTYTNTMTVTSPSTYETYCGWSPATDNTCQATDSVTVLKAAAVGLQKWDKGSEPNVAQDTGKADSSCPDWGGYTRYPCVAQTLPGGDFSYLLRISNQGNTPLTNEVAYDVLPYVGDTGVGQSLAGSARKTEWAPRLSGPITLENSLTTATDADPVVEYNLTTNPCRPELNQGSEDATWQGSCDDTWYTDTQITDWSSVKSFRVKAYQAEGATWAPGSRLVFKVPMIAPADAAYSVITADGADLSVAWNSASQRAYKLNDDGTATRMLSTEPRKVGIIIPAPYVSIGDYVWYDANYNGRQDKSESPAEGVEVTLKDVDGTTVGTTTTDAEGYYWFTDLMADTKYTLTFTRPDGYSWTVRDAGSDDSVDSDVDPDTGTISFTSPQWEAGVTHNLGGADLADNPRLDAGLVVPKPLVSVGDFVWWDTNRDGLQTAGEQPVADVSVNLYDATGELLDTTKTDSNGYYWFTNLISDASYTVEFVKPDGTMFTTQNAGGVSSNSSATDLSDSDAPANGRVEFVAEPSGSNNGGADKADNPGIDAGLLAYNLVLHKSLDTVGKIRIGQDVTFTLTPKNEGPVDSLSGWTVTDVLPAGLVLKSIAGTGYTCDEATASCVAAAPLAAGVSGAPITVVATVGPGTSGTLKNVAYVSPSTSDTVPESNVLGVPPTTGTDTVTSPTDNDAEASVTVSPLVSIGDFVWWDHDRDGVQDADEPVYAGMTVNLYDLDGDLVDTTTTDVDGYYAFGGLEASSTYSVGFVKADGENFTSRASGDDPALDSNVYPATGRAAVTTPSTGGNLTDPGKADDPTIDAGVYRYNLKLAKALVTEGPFYEGATVTFTLTPSNEGPSTALAGWSVTDLLPTGLTLVSMTGDGYSCTGATCTSGSALAGGASGAPITVVATIDGAFTGSAHNVAYASPATGDGPETNPLDTPTRATDTDKSATDNDAQASLSVASLVSIGDYVWFDDDRDGAQDGEESPVVGVTVNLYAADGTTLLKSTTTDGDGFYSFTGLTPGVGYVVEFVKPANSVFTVQDSAAGDTADSDANRDTGRVSVTAPASGSNSATTPDDPTIDAGLVRLVSVGDYVWFDDNRNGQQDDGEAPVPGVVVNLYDASGTLVDSTTTTDEGFYSFADLEAGAEYTVEFVKPANTVFTDRDKGDDTSDSDADVVTGKVEITAPTIGENSTTEPDDPTIDAGLVRLVSVGDYVWFDNNRNGQQDAAEPAVPSVTVNLYDNSGKLVATTLTDANGFYSFTDLTAATDYTITFVKPDGTTFTLAQTGARESDSNADVETGEYAFTSPASGNNSAATPDDPTIDAGLVKLNLALTKTLATKGTVRPGNTLVYYLTPRNVGLSDALPGWRVTELPPQGLTITSMSGDGYDCVGLTCVARAGLAGGTDGAVITVTATVDRGVTNRLVNKASVETAVLDVTQPPDDDTADAEVTPTPADGNLAFTGVGTAVSSILGLAMALVIAGAALLLVRRRRTES